MSRGMSIRDICAAVAVTSLVLLHIMALFHCMKRGQIPEGADPVLALLYPVPNLQLYIDRTQSLRTSDQLFVCCGGQQKGKTISKQRMAHWIVNAIALAYQAQGMPWPLRLHAHSARGVASSWALARGTSLTYISRAAGWATPNTFARFYSLRVEPISSRVLTSGQRHGEAPA